MFKNFFARSRTVPAYEIFSKQHITLLIMSAVFVIALLFASRKSDEKGVLRSIRSCVWVMCIMEVFKMLFSHLINRYSYYFSLYYCSIPLFVGWCSAYGKGRWKRLGDVFLLVGGFIGSVAYFVSPITTAGKYPMMHCITIQSYVHHAIMLYISLLILFKNYIKLKAKDIFYYIIPIVVFCGISYFVNIRLDENYMFVNRNMPGTPIEIVYNFNPAIFPFAMTFVQAVLPFPVVYGLVKIYEKVKDCLKKEEDISSESALTH